MDIYESNWAIYEFTKLYQVPVTFAQRFVPASVGNPAHDNFIQNHTVERRLDFEITWKPSQNGYDAVLPSKLEDFKNKVNGFHFEGCEQKDGSSIMTELKNYLQGTLYSSSFTIKMMETFVGLADGNMPYSRTGYSYQSKDTVQASLNQNVVLNGSFSINNPQSNISGSFSSNGTTMV